MNCATPAMIVKQRCLATKIIYFRNLKGFCCTHRAGPSFFLFKLSAGPSQVSRERFNVSNRGDRGIFLFLYYYFFRFVKNICRNFYFANMSSSRQFIRQKKDTGGKIVGPRPIQHTAGSSGDSYLPPDELAVGATAGLQRGYSRTVDAQCPIAV